MSYNLLNKKSNHLVQNSDKDIEKIELLFDKMDRIKGSLERLTIIQAILTLVVGIAALGGLGLAAGSQLNSGWGSVVGAIVGSAIFILLVFFWQFFRRKR